MAKKVTMVEIAKELHCSVSVVSRALNDKYGVSSETRAKVRIKAMKMGFDFKNIVENGRGKRKNDAPHINVVVTQKDLLDECFYLKILYSIEDALTRRQAEFSLSILDGRQESLWVDMKRNGAAGVIVMGLVPNEELLAIMSSGLPLVLVDTALLDLSLDRITVNNYRGSYLATNYLIERGHRDISFVGIQEYSFSFDERYRGYRKGIQALENRGYAVRPEATRLWDIEEGETLLSSPQRPTAVVCANDRLALRISETADRLGLTIPRDLSVIGFDDIDKCEWVSPRLTSVYYPKQELGEEAVKLILERIAQRQISTRLVQMDTHIVERESVANGPALMEGEKPLPLGLEIAGAIPAGVRRAR